MAPLSRLSRKNEEFEFIRKNDVAAQTLKHATCSTPVLATTDRYNLELTPTTDASQVGDYETAQAHKGYWQEGSLSDDCLWDEKYPAIGCHRREAKALNVVILCAKVEF